MSSIPSDLKYASSHEWVRAESDGTLTVGISDHAQASLGDLVFVEAPAAGRKVAAGEACAVVESVKAASDIYSPVAGEVIASNDALAARPELINEEPYGAGWIFKLRPADASLQGLLDAKGYEAAIDAEK